jgi:hypothetical protein
MRIPSFALSLLLASCGGLTVQVGPEVAHRTTLAEVAWILGDWEAAVDEHGCTYHESWHRDSDMLFSGHASETCDPALAEREPFDEDLRIQAEARGLVYVAWPTGQERTEFDFTSGDASGFVSENPDHDFPTRIEYRHTETGIEAIVSGPGRSFTLTMRSLPPH